MNIMILAAFPSTVALVALLPGRSDVLAGIKPFHAAGVRRVCVFTQPRRRGEGPVAKVTWSRFSFVRGLRLALFLLFGGDGR